MKLIIKAKTKREMINILSTTNFCLILDKNLRNINLVDKNKVVGKIRLRGK